KRNEFREGVPANGGIAGHISAPAMADDAEVGQILVAALVEVRIFNPVIVGIVSVEFGVAFANRIPGEIHGDGGDLVQAQTGLVLVVSTYRFPSRSKITSLRQLL